MLEASQLAFCSTCVHNGRDPRKMLTRGKWERDEKRVSKHRTRRSCFPEADVPGWQPVHQVVWSNSGSARDSVWMPTSKYFYHFPFYKFWKNISCQRQTAIHLIFLHLWVLWEEEPRDSPCKKTLRLHTESSEARQIKPMTFLHWWDGADHCTTVWPYIHFKKKKSNILEWAALVFG